MSLGALYLITLFIWVGMPILLVVWCFLFSHATRKPINLSVFFAIQEWKYFSYFPQVGGDAGALVFLEMAVIPIILVAVYGLASVMGFTGTTLLLTVGMLYVVCLWLPRKVMDNLNKQDK